MKTIWKYQIPLEEMFEIEMPVQAEVLTVALQGEVPHIWALVNDDAPKLKRKFQLRGTGASCEGFRRNDHHTLQSVRRGEPVYVGTFMIAEGKFVFHLFEEWSWR